MAAFVALAAQVFGFGTSVDVDTDATSYLTGDMLTVSVTVVNMTPMEAEVDFYLALKCPSGELLCYPGWSGSIEPAVSGVVLSD